MLDANTDAGGNTGSPSLFSPLKRDTTRSFLLDREDTGYGGGSRQLAEVVLDCVKADGIDLAMLPPGEKSIAFPVEPGTHSLKHKCLVGREHQSDFFDRLVPRKEFLACISRSHFELRLESGAALPTLRKLSRNPLHVNNLPVGVEDTMLADKTLLGFKGVFDAEPCFLILCVTYRGQSALEYEGPHPSLTPRLHHRRPSTLNVRRACIPQSPPDCAQQPIGAVLECVHSAGASLSMLQPNVKVIPLPLDTPLDIGRHCQFEVFGQVLQTAQQLLTLISRRHCTVQLSNGEPPSPGSVAGASKVAEELGSSSARGRATWLLVENLSTNALSVDGHLLGRGSTRVMAEGATVAFVRPADGGASDNFLEFRLRRARMSTKF